MSSKKPNPRLDPAIQTFVDLLCGIAEGVVDVATGCGVQPAQAATAMELARAAQHMTKDALRIKAHVSPGTLVKVLAGDWHTLPYSSIARTAQALGLSLGVTMVTPDTEIEVAA